MKIFFFYFVLIFFLNFSSFAKSKTSELYEKIDLFSEVLEKN